MALTPEWRRRIDHYRNYLEQLCFRKLSDLELSVHFTHEQLSLAQAEQLKFQPIGRGDAWGSKWEYGWFVAHVTVPAEADGERIAFRTRTGGEALVYVNGVARSSELDNKNWGHPEVHLPQRAKAGERYEVLIEAYAGHGPISVGQGPVPHGTVTMPEPPAKQRKVGESCWGIWDEDVYQALIDFETLVQVRDHIDPESLRVAEIDAGLRDFTVLVDLELPRQELLAEVKRGRARLEPLLECHNGSTAPAMHCFGHAHIDVAWLWPLAETERKCGRTFSTQLSLMEEYPEYRFLQSQPHLYEMTKRLYPEVYQGIKAASEKGQWIVEGGMWVEADTNISGGEALIRQFLYGKRFMKEEFGVESELLWLPDVFGYSGAMPQILAGCGVKYFSTQKIFWNYNGGEQFPFNTFWWQGIDGTKVLSHFHNDYNAKTEPKHLIGRWKERVQKDGVKGRLYPFGFGDGGGGPTRDHLEYLRRQTDLEGVPKAAMANPVDFFHTEEKRGSEWPTYVGELYFQAHRGTYTSQAKTKAGNRKSEIALRELELWGAMAARTGKYTFPQAEVAELWKIVLLNQFHDIIPGSSIRRVYEEAEAGYEKVLSYARRATEDAARALLAEEGGKVTAFNSLSFARRALVPVPKDFSGAVDAAGQALLLQTHEGKRYALVPALPACGFATITKAPAQAATSSVRAEGRELENEELKLVFDEHGAITSIIDKRGGKELAAGRCNAFKMYKDVPGNWDAWDIDSTYKAAPVELGEKASIEVVASGPAFAALEIKRRLHDSEVTQTVRLCAGSRRVDFATRIEWRETHKLLKVDFPVTIHADEAVHEIQFGHLRRPTHASRQYDADRFEVCNHKWTALCEENRGVALLNDSKYGVSVEGNSINLTLLKSATAPDMQADRGLQEFTYSFYAYSGSFAESRLVEEAYELNVPVLAMPGAGPATCFFSVDAANVMIEAVKPAEDGSGDVIVRLYEAKRSATECKLRLGLAARRVQQTDMLEENPQPLALGHDGIALSFRPFEIKTLRFSF